MDLTEKEKPANEKGGHSNRHTSDVSEEQPPSQWKCQQELEKSGRYSLGQTFGKMPCLSPSISKGL